MGDEVGSLPADKHNSFKQVDSITLGVRSYACPKYPKITSLQYLCNVSRKTQRKKFIFCLLRKVKGFFKVILSL